MDELFYNLRTVRSTMEAPAVSFWSNLGKWRAEARPILLSGQGQRLLCFERRLPAPGDAP